MKMDMSAKPGADEATVSQDGDYSCEELDCMLEKYVDAKKIEADPKLFSLLKDYAMSKNKMVSELFDVNRTPSAKPKSIADLKKIKAKMDQASMDKSEGESTMDSEDSTDTND